MQTRDLRTNEWLIRAIRDQKLLNTYYYYLKFKSVFVSSCLHDRNFSKLSRITGFSLKTIRKHLAIMQEAGWVKMDGDHLVFLGFNEMFALYKKNWLIHKARRRVRRTISIQSQSSIGQIKNAIAALLVTLSVKRQLFFAKLKNDACDHKLHFKRRNVLKRKLRSRGVSMHDVQLNTEIVARLSCGRIGTMVGLGKTSGYNVKRALVEMGVIKAEKSVEVVAEKIPYALYMANKHLLPSNIYYFFLTGQLIQRKADVITINTNNKIPQLCKA